MNDDDGLRDLFVPFTSRPKEYRLNPDAVRNESSYRNCLPYLRDENTRNHNNPEHTLVVKSPNFFVDKGRLVSHTKATVASTLTGSTQDPLGEALQQTIKALGKQEQAGLAGVITAYLARLHPQVHRVRQRSVDADMDLGGQHRLHRVRVDLTATERGDQ